MISAAVVSSLRVLRIRDASRCSAVRAVGRDQRHHADPGLEAGQAQHQQRERQHGGPSSAAEAAAARRSARAVQSRHAPGSCDDRRPAPTTTTTALSTRNTATSGMATTTASLKPSRNTPAEDQQQHHRDQRPRGRAGSPAGSGFSIMCTVASAADRVIVMIHEVATKPSSTSTKTLPRQNGSRSPASPPSPARAGSPGPPAGTSAACPAASAPRSAASPAGTARRRPAPRCPAGRTGWRSSPRRSGT